MTNVNVQIEGGQSATESTTSAMANVNVSL